jgi:protoporphyrinogen oxidase
MAKQSSTVFPHPPRVLVVGAGMAGLAAGQALQRAGFQVRVVEQNDAVGGRVKSQAFHGRTIECGAQFPSSGYRHMPALLAGAGLADRVHATSPWAAFERGGRLFRVHQNRPWTLVGSGLLSAGDGARLMAGALPLGFGGWARDRSSYAAYASLDNEDALAWCRRRLGRGASAHVLAPTVHGLYFHPLENTSRALVAAVLSFHRAHALAVRGGWNQLARAMAAEVDVQTGAVVEGLRELAHGVEVRVGGERAVVDGVVLAVPAPCAQRLLESPIALEEAVLAAAYAPAVHVALGMQAGWALPEPLRGVHGTLLPPADARADASVVASVVVESARLAVPAAPEVLTFMLAGRAAHEPAAGADLPPVQQAVAWLEARWPGSARAVVAHRVQRWACAEPLSPVGRARAIARYRQGLPAGRRIVLCGDYMGMPWTDGAIETGHWAAGHLCRLGRCPQRAAA